MCNGIELNLGPNQRAVADGKGGILIEEIEMTNETIEYVYSVDEESFSDDTLYALIMDNDLEIGATVSRGEKRELTGEDLVNHWVIECLLEHIGEIAYDKVGECAEFYPEVPKEKKEELAEVIRAWIMETCKPHFYRVENIVDYVLTAEDFEEIEK